MQKRTVFFVSDSTGITAKKLGQSLLAQFENIEFEKVVLPYIDNEAKALAVVEQVNKAFERDSLAPIIFDTIIQKDIRKIISRCNGFMVDIFTAFLKPLEKELQQKSSYSVGMSHHGIENAEYKDRINAVHYALDNDDGAKLDKYGEADIILVGVSRSGKTPTSLYLAMQWGIYAANYPLTDDDLEDLRLPKSLIAHKDKLFGLTIAADRLSAIRNERRANCRYSSMRQCEIETRNAEALFRRYGIPTVDATHQSIEEISTRILMATNLGNNDRY